ncbi:MAG: YdeI/OmpD-associated family protein [Flammeovirgaceae bacterium]
MNKLPLDIDSYLATGCGRCPLGGTPNCKVLNWQEELIQLRAFVLDCGLTEEIKWGVPCYTFQQKNILLLSALKDYCAISFFKGALLKNSHHILSKPGPNSQAARMIKFHHVDEVLALEVALKAHILEAIEVEKAGLKVSFKQNPEPIPEELQLKLAEDPIFRAAFEALTPGRQRGYIIHFSQPKQSKTRSSRIEKCVPKILNGEGLNDKYQSRKRN